MIMYNWPKDSTLVPPQATELHDGLAKMLTNC